MTLYIFLLGICVASATASICADTDATLCDLMLNRVPEFCGDPCLAKYCKRSCRKCPLQCYDCTEVADVSNCSQVTTCQDPSDYCFTAQTFTSHFTEAYRLGCGNRQTCLQYTHGRTRASLEAGCCNTDRCNNKPPPILKIEPEQNYTGAGPTNDPSVCINRDDDVCLRLTLLLGSSNLCADDCVATKLCPHTCRKCFYCLDCYEVDDPNNCTQTTACGHGKECYGLEKLGSDFTQVAQLGCIDRKLCEQLSSPSGHIFGRSIFNFKGGCCVGDKCNANPVTTLRSLTTAPTETTPTIPLSTNKQCPHYSDRCPAGFQTYSFYQHQHDCFLFNWTKMTKQQAKAFCQDNCAELLYLDPSASNLNELRFLSHHPHTNVFLDITKRSDGHWISSHDNMIVSNYITRNFQQPERHHCLIARHNQGREELIAVACNTLHFPVCKIRLS